jgi:hypothetical protein
VAFVNHKKAIFQLFLSLSLYLSLLLIQLHTTLLPCELNNEKEIFIFFANQIKSLAREKRNVQKFNRLENEPNA